MVLHSADDDALDAAGVLAHLAGGEARRHEHIAHVVGLTLAHFKD